VLYRTLQPPGERHVILVCDVLERCWRGVASVWN